MRVFVSVDIEGVAGVVHLDQTEPHKGDWERSRVLMTGEANAAVEGALEAGAQAIVVADSHWGMRNLLPERLHPTAELLSGYPRPLSMMEGIGPGFDAAFFVGYHAAAGSQSAGIAHTYADERLLLETRVNGRRQTEGSLNAGLCGQFDCPLVLFTGDTTAVAQMHEFIPEVEGVVVKESAGWHSARSLAPSVACERIRSGARRALERVDSIPAYRPQPPFELEMDFVHAGMADQCELVPGVRRLSGRVVAYRSDDYIELYKLMLALVFLAEAGVC